MCSHVFTDIPYEKADRNFFHDFKNISFYLKLAVAVIPALALGKLFDDKIEAVLGDPVPIAIVLILGGVVLLFIDKLFKVHIIDDEKDVSYKSALIIGFWQCLAMMPGTSRSAASIIGGMQQKLTRKAAAEFSFFLAIPIMFGWGLVKCIKFAAAGLAMTTTEGVVLAVGVVSAFVMSVVSIKFLMGYIKKNDFTAFGWYRIVVGALVLGVFVLQTVGILA